MCVFVYTPGFKRAPGGCVCAHVQARAVKPAMPAPLLLPSGFQPVACAEVLTCVVSFVRGPAQSCLYARVCVSVTAAAAVRPK